MTYKGLNKNIIESIRMMRKTMPQREVALKLALSEMTIRKYETDKNIEKYNSMINVYRSRPEVRLSKRRYMRKYMRNRYHDDAEFRQRCIGNMMRWQRKEYTSNPEYRAKVIAYQRNYRKKMSAALAKSLNSGEKNDF